MISMKRIPYFAVILLVSISVLTSCTNGSNEGPAVDLPGISTTSSDIGSDTSVPDNASSQPSPDQSVPTTEMVNEPPLQETDLTIAVPDFLSEEQQLLYRRAYNLYSHTKLGSDIEYAGNNIDLSQYETIQIGEYDYYVSQGPYKNWDDFRTVMCSVFTENYWNRFTDNTSLKEYNGRLCFLDAAMGVGYFYDKTSTDTFRLESKTNAEIHFTLIGHYAGEWTQDEINTTGEELHYYTLEFPMSLVLAENGWRFDEFHSALLEEDYPFYGNQ